MRDRLPYRGAGVLLLCQRRGDPTLVLLGRRRYAPNRGALSIPGGGMEPQDRGDYVTCGRREALEELPGIEMLMPNEASGERVRLFIPGLFHWITVVYVIDHAPTVSTWLQGPTPEFERQSIGWYPTTKLPREVHWGVRWTLWHVR